MGEGRLNANGRVQIDAPTCDLAAGSYHLTFRYSGNETFAATQTTESLTVQVAETTPTSTPTTITAPAWPRPAATAGCWRWCSVVRR